MTPIEEFRKEMDKLEKAANDHHEAFINLENTLREKGLI